MEAQELQKHPGQEGQVTQLDCFQQELLPRAVQNEHKTQLEIYLKPPFGKEGGKKEKTVLMFIKMLHVHTGYGQRMW